MVGKTHCGLRLGGVVITTCQERSTSWRAHRRGVKARVTEAVLGEAIESRGRNKPPKLLAAENPTSSVRIGSTFGAPADAFTGV